MLEHEYKKQQVEAAAQGMVDVVGGLANAMNRSAVERGIHSTEYFKEPRVDTFGTFVKKWRYTEGCTIDTELENNRVGELVVAMRRPDGQKRVASIGRTPSEWDPKQGSQKILAGAGDPGDYLAVIVDGVGTEDERMTYRYLDAVDIAGVTVEHGERITFKENLQRRRHLSFEGTVERVVGLLGPEN